MLKHEIITEFQSRIEDDTYWDSARALTLANSALRKIVARLDIKSKFYIEFYFVEDEQRYQRPENFISGNVLVYDSDHGGGKLIIGEVDNVYGMVSEPTSSGKPTRAFWWPVEDLPELWVYPVPDQTYTMHWFYIGKAPKLVNDNDSPQIPDELHEYIVDYMEWRAKVQDEQISELEFQALWEATVVKMRSSQAKKYVYGRKTGLGSGKEMFLSIQYGVFKAPFTLEDPTGVQW